MGRASAQALADLGAEVVCVDIDEGLAEEVAREIGGIAVLADVTDRADMERVMTTAAGDLDRFAGVVDVVGMARWSSLLTLDDETWSAQFDICLRHAYLTVQIAGRELARAGRGGTIAFVSSTSGITGAPNHAAYGAAKAAMISLVKSAAVELAPHGVRVNAVAPGTIMTDRLAGSLFQDPDYAAAQAANVPMGRVGEVVDIAGVMLFLSSDLSSYVTGTTLTIDGGVAAKFAYATPSFD